MLLKYADTDSTLTLPLQRGLHARIPDRANSWTQYRTRFGFHVPGRAHRHRHHRRDRDRPHRADVAAAPRAFAPRAGALAPIARRPVFFDGAWRDTPFFERDILRPGDAIDGPAVICERNTTVVVERGWRATLTAADDLVLEKIGAARERETAVDAAPTPCCSRSSTTCSWPSPSRWA